MKRMAKRLPEKDDQIHHTAIQHRQEWLLLRSEPDITRRQSGRENFTAHSPSLDVHDPRLKTSCRFTACLTAVRATHVRSTGKAATYHQQGVQLPCLGEYLAHLAQLPLQPYDVFTCRLMRVETGRSSPHTA